MEPNGAVPTLTIAGAAEFLPDRVVPAPQKTGQAGPGQITKAYDRQQVDAGPLSPAAAAWFGASFPKGFFPVTASPVLRSFAVSLPSGEKRHVLLVFFPPLHVRGTAESESPSPALLASVLASARAALAEIRGRGATPALVVGVSPWGFQAERAALPHLAGLFHVLLGAGEGAPFPAEAPEQAPSVLWSRAELDGKSLIVLDFLEMPEGADWDPPLAARARAISLNASVAADPEIEALLQH